MAKKALKVTDKPIEKITKKKVEKKLKEFEKRKQTVPETIMSQPLPVEPKPVIKTVNTWELDQLMTVNRMAKPDITEGAYRFKTEHGTMYVQPQDIIHALQEQANSEETEITPPDIDLQGWGIIHATDEKGDSRPLLLMRVLPAPTLIRPYKGVREDDKAMQDIILKEVYKLTPRRIKWIRFKGKIRSWVMRILKREKVPESEVEPIKPPKYTDEWLGNVNDRDVK